MDCGTRKVEYDEYCPGKAQQSTSVCQGCQGGLTVLSDYTNPFRPQLPS